MKKRNIVLIGPMGTGKSRAAKILAENFDWQLADTDRIMERLTGQKMAAYWERVGQKRFAETEMDVVNHVRFYHEAVIAMGGNFPMTEEKFQLLSEYGLVVLLIARPFRLAERVSKRIGKRPTMDYSNVDGYVRKMRSQWESWKPRADIVVNTTNRQPAQTALLITQYIETHHIEFVARFPENQRGR